MTIVIVLLILSLLAAGTIICALIIAGRSDDMQETRDEIERLLCEKRKQDK